VERAQQESEKFEGSLFAQLEVNYWHDQIKHHCWENELKTLKARG
jgi:hypothetical protein